ncbi:MAG: c-type cytochrome biogenesis protein CcmI [Rhizobiales bacterium]|jgi:cytochrome c-type biogenesis protein CcmH|nr:c-type cytochrome biogenesis protein CcmI [Hyphomicrobiales bacterium]
MNWFIAISALLLAGVLVFLLRPLLRGAEQATEGAEARAVNLAILREQRAELERELAGGSIDKVTYEHAVDELERRTLEDACGREARPRMGRRRPLVAVAVALCLPALALGLYFVLGQPQVLPGDKAKQTAADGSHALSQEQILGMVERLSEKLQANPNDGAGWLMLARSYSVLGRFPESAAAYGRAVGLMPPDAQMLADFADTIAMAQGRRLLGEPEKIVRRALEIDPRNLKALALSGTIYFERQDYGAAIGEWKKVLALVPPESNVATGIQGSIQDAESRLAGSGQGAARPVVDRAPSISGIVALDPSLNGKFSPTDTVFVFARAENGPKMPLAIVRKTVADLPLHFTLDDSMAMSANFRLSQQATVVVGARISRQGDALPRQGDWQGLTQPVAPGIQDVKIVINSMIN